MKKLILLCFLGKVCPYPNRSSLTLLRLVSPYRQPQAEIFHRQIRFISPATGWHISIPTYQKWFLPACLILSILLVRINDVYSKVASSPEVPDFPHFTMAPLGSGETRSSLRSFPQGFSLVDDSNSHRQGRVASPAVGELSANPVLIYLELSKRGDLDTLTFETVPFQVSRLHPNYGQKEIFLVGKRGSFLEGVNPVSDQIFLFESIDYQEPGYISIKRGEEIILDNYLVFPGDSIKVRIQEAANRISFAGPDAALFECQYQMAIAGDQRRFARASQMMTDDAEEFLSRGNYRERYQKAKNNFGGSLELVEFGSEEKELWMEQWQMPIEELPEWKVLESFRNRIPNEGYEILQADLIGNYRAALLGKFRKEMYGRAVQTHDSLMVSNLNDLFLNDLLPDELVVANGISSFRDVSSGWLAYQYEQAYLKALITTSSFSKGVQESYSGGLRAKILLKFLMDKFQQIPTKSAFMERISSFMVTAEQKSQLEEYRSKYVSGIPIQDFLFEDRNGNRFAKADFTDRLVLFYFWSTGCGASENFYKETFDELAAEYQNSEQVVLVAVNASPTAELWERGLSSGNYSSDKLLNLYMGVEAQEWKTHYNIHMFPQLMMMDPKGRNLEILFLGEDAASINEQIKSALSASGNENLSFKD